LIVYLEFGGGRGRIEMKPRAVKTAYMAVTQ
jgi:hypothetical protein